MKRRPRYSPEFRQRAVRLGLDSDRTIREVAADLGMHHGTLNSWMAREREQRRAAGAAVVSPARRSKAELVERAGAERQRLKELERENAELRRANEILKAATAFFAQE